MDLIGKLLPIKDKDGVIVKYAAITNFAHVDNMAGVLVSTNHGEPSFFVSYGDALNLRTKEGYDIQLKKARRAFRNTILYPFYITGYVIGFFMRDFNAGLFAGSTKSYEFSKR